MSVGLSHLLRSALLGCMLQLPMRLLPVAAQQEITWEFFIEQGPFVVPVGGSFTFEYSGFHNVVKVADQQAFDNCNANMQGELVGTSGGSGTSVTLAFDTPGTFYYICDIGGHCESGGMKLIIEVPEPEPAPPSELKVDWMFNNDPGPFIIAQGGLLTFAYQGFHNIVQVPNQMMLDDCIEESGFILSGSQGSSIEFSMVMNEAGTFYYICGIGTHCENFNMQLVVEVVATESSSLPIPVPEVASMAMPIPSPTICSLEPGSGDTNNDGIVNVLDIVNVIAFITSPEDDKPLDDCEAAAADVNGDGAIDVLDALGIRSLVLTSGP